MKPEFWDKRRRRVKLIYNPFSGTGGNSSPRLMTVLGLLQDWGFIPEVYLIEKDCGLSGVIADALAKGVRMFVACGGDGTVSSVARELFGLSATLGILPAGTQNNIAMSLGIPEDIPSAAALLRMGRRVRVDMGLALCEGEETPFLEVCSVGLVSELFPSSDDIQHGKLGRIGDFLSTLAASPPADILLALGEGERVRGKGHVVLISNMPYVGRHYPFAGASCRDGFLDVLYSGELSKLDLIGYAFRRAGKQEDPRIRHFRIKSMEIETDPPMTVMADGRLLGRSPLRLETRRHALGIITGRTASSGAPEAENV